jgi:hypothetical protein
VGAEHVGEAPGGIGRIAGILDVLVEDGHGIVVQVEIGDLDAGFTQFCRHVAAKYLVDAIAAQRTADGQCGLRLERCFSHPSSF